MSDDRTISELISQSLRKNLSEEDEKVVLKNVEENEEARKFAELSKRIHESVARYKPSDEDVATKSVLPDDVRRRLNDTVVSAMKEKLSMSQDGLIQSPSSRSSSPLDSSKSGLGEAGDGHKELVVRFQLIRKLATGGIGEVWVARDDKLGRNVVIKELNSIAKESAQAWDRFQREAEITGLLEHPNIVPLYLFGVDRRTAEPFYAMRFVGQRNLANAIEEHHDRVAAGQGENLSLHRLLNIFLDVCQAIAYAHSRGVIHRDLKPENVAIDNFGQVIVLDWGLAKIMEDSELGLKLNNSSNMTESSLLHSAHGDVIGTPVYMSPEQAGGQVELIDTRTDVYGLGAILFSILTGKAPHGDLATEKSSGFREVISQIAEAPTPEPSRFANVASDLEEICIRALARKRHLRFDSVAMLSEAVESWMVGQSGKKVGYEKLRMEGRELRTDMQSRVHDLERNVSFCSTLPPVQELINADAAEDQKVWRQRMATILVGLMGANPGYQSLVYGRFEGDSYTEIVRVEKQKGPGNTARTIPKSRLQTLKQNSYLQKLAGQLPGEQLTALVGGKPTAEGGVEVHLQSGVPIYDRDTEEVFGFIVVTCDVYQLLEQQLNRRHNAGEIIVACDTFDVMSHKRKGQMVAESRSSVVDEVSPWFTPVVDHLQSHLDFIDESDSEIYGARIWFDPNKSGLMFLLKL